MCIYRRTLIVLLLSLFLLFSIGCAQKYAVLISTNQVTADDVAYHSEWWYDLFLHYKMLKENGFNDDKIYVLYGNGADFNTIHGDYNSITQFGHSITDMAVNKSNIQSVFNTMNSKVKSKDYLYVWWMGHGGGSGPGSCNLTMSISNTGETVTDTELTGYINSVLNYKKRSVAVMTCHSGGIVDNLNSAGNKTVALASSTCVESSYDGPTCNALFHAEFNYTLPNALRLVNPCGTAVGSDYDSNGDVSLSEAHQYNTATMTTSTTQMGDPDSIAATTYIKKREP
jgi:glycosylphosphatidylinositol transamidase (GPIT) subunit GPI8